ncbi:serine hydrolase [Blautia schinkii]|nr:serine hydrolase [Blautia schinkii]
MNTREHTEMKMRGSADVSYLGKTVDEMVWEFMEEQGIPGLTLAIVQAPYIPRVVGYGFSDAGQKRLATVNTLWPAGPISQGYVAVAVMQLVESGSVDLDTPASAYVDGLPEQWRRITLRQLLHHASGLADYRGQDGFSLTREWTFEELTALTAELPLRFEPGSEVEQSATNFLLLTEVVGKASGMPYQEFVKKNQFEALGLKHTSFSDGLSLFHQEDLTLSEYVHQIFKTDGKYIDPAETAASYRSDGSAYPQMHSSAFRGFGDVWASAQDISFWDIGLAGGVLIKKPENRAVVYAPWTLPDGRIVPGSAGWQFYHHRGLMDIKGSVPGFSSFLSRFTHPEELVCVTLMANKEDVDFTNLGRRIAGAFGDLLSTNYDDNRLYLAEGQFSVDETTARLEKQLEALDIPVFAKFDHAKNAEEAGLELRPTTVLVFGAPKVGTGLMQADQSIALELPLRIAVWEDEAGSTWLAFPKMKQMALEYGLLNHPVIGNMQKLLEKLVKNAANLY